MLKNFSFCRLIFICKVVLVISCSNNIDLIKKDIQSVYSQQEVVFEKNNNTKPLNGVVLVCHGLNTKPEKMQEITTFLNSLGVFTFSIKLYGHRSDFENFKKVRPAIWLSEFHKAYKEAKKYADKRQVPLFFVGYSLGGLINSSLMSSKILGDIKYNKIILFAPSIATHFYIKIISFLNILGEQYVIPSSNLKAYRASKGTPLSAYNSLFSLQNLMIASDFNNLNIPTMIFVDPQDELVSVDGISSLIRNKNLSKWQIVRLHKTHTSSNKSSHHLIIDKSSAGNKNWEIIKQRIKVFLGFI